jgi:endoglucanase
MSRRPRPAVVLALAVVVLAALPTAGLAKDRLNPLDLSPAPPRSNPLRGAHFFVDHQYGLASRQVRFWNHHGHRRSAAILTKIAREPETKRFGPWTRGIHTAIRRLLDREDSQAPGTVPLLSAYRLRHERCGRYDAGGRRDARRYRRWIDQFATAVGGHRAVIFLEPDAIITSGCLSGSALRDRMRLLRFAIRRLDRLPRSVVYLDGGAADAHSVGKTTHLLKLAGVSGARGFFLNATHYDWTSREVRYGQAISRRLGGKHFIVSTAVNGRGPLVPHSRVRHGNEVLCNPPGRALGPRPTTHVAHRGVDAYFWIGNPGRSGGHCRPGAPGTGVWWPAYALGLARRAAY